ncbi:MAG: hypothetical protein BEU05_01860 [Marine Group III euryarchaeote CG-Bathy2]|uniref:Uncharacterized protein n=1 Tax=Marine Group III euryarchaeote CG-Bathy2 TaxID=1889002 RepID=A0A1J5SP68_9ARCH|nr:MAG: hypothetical protein BEU05_01860 [Marine Group III euryarchaeote CG-Bathy2]
MAQLKERPQLLLPECRHPAGECPYPGVRTQLERAVEPDERGFLGRMFGRRLKDPLALALRASLSLLDAGKAPVMAVARYPAGEVGYVQRGQSIPKERLIGVQNFHHRTWRTLAHLAYVRRHDIWLYSLPKRLVCTGKSSALPSELWDELRSTLPRGWRDSDGEGLRLRCVSLDRTLRLPAAGWRRSSRNSLLDVLEHQHASDAAADWEVEVVTPLDALAPAAEFPALDEYREGKITDAELWTQLGDWQRERAAAGGAHGVIHGSEMLTPDDFVARLSLSGHDARIASELLACHDGAVAVEALTLGAVAGATWKPHGQRLLDEWGGAADEREPLEQLRDALARAKMQDALAALPELEGLPPLPALANRAVRLLRTGRREDLQRELATAAEASHGEQALAWAILRHTGNATGREWQFAREVREFAEELQPAFKTLATAEGGSYEDALQRLAQLGGAEF